MRAGAPSIGETPVRQCGHAGTACSSSGKPGAQRYAKRECTAMTLHADVIHDIVTSGGWVKYKNIGPIGQNTGGASTGDDPLVAESYYKLKLEVSAADKTISLTRLANAATEWNCVDIRTEENRAIMGVITPPGYIYTDEFSGCVFYLYQLPSGQVMGVHAYSGLKQQFEKTKKGKFNVINEVVREYSPKDYFTRNPGKEICRYPTRQELRVRDGENYLAFLSVVERDAAMTFLFAYKNTPEGRRVTRLVHDY